MLKIFRELGCTGNYFRDLRSKLIVLGILGALQKSKNKFMNSYLKGKASISFFFFLIFWLLRGSPYTPPPLENLNVFTFELLQHATLPWYW